jgi:subtilisin family serine protease
VNRSSSLRRKGLIAGFAITALMGLTQIPVANGRAFQPASTEAASVYIVRTDNDQTAARDARRVVARSGGRVGFVYDRVLQGFSARMSQESAQRLAGMPGVISVERAGIVRAYNSQSVRHIGGLKVRKQLGLTGKGITVAVIDSGIDYTHKAFGGLGTVAAYRGNDPEVIEEGSFPTAKVIAGYDFVGDPYDPIDSRSDNDVPDPDPDPLDVQGHGTHVGATCCGKGVPGVVGRGVAPRVKVVALKVWGNGGASTADVLVAAYERALDPNDDGDTSDRVDVVSFSGGVTFGTQDSAESVAAQELVDAGVVFVAAAGNAGNEYSGVAAYTVGSPATAPGVLAVGATDLADDAAGFSSQGPSRLTSALKPDVVAPGSDIFSAEVGSGDGGSYKSGTSMATPHVSGSAALLLQRHAGASPAEVSAMLMGPARPAYVSDTRDPTVTGAGRIDVYRSARTGFVVLPSSVSLGRLELTEGSLPVVPLTVRSLTERATVGTISAGDVHGPIDFEISFSTDGETFSPELAFRADPEITVLVRFVPAESEISGRVQSDRWYEHQIQAWGRLKFSARKVNAVNWQATLAPASLMEAPDDLAEGEPAMLGLEVSDSPGRSAAEVYPHVTEDPSGDGMPGADIRFGAARSFAGPGATLPTEEDPLGRTWLGFAEGDEDIAEPVEIVAVLDEGFETSRALTASVTLTDGERTITYRKPLYEPYWCRVAFGGCSGTLRGGYPSLHSSAMSVVADGQDFEQRDVSATFRVCGDAFSGDVLMPECDTVEIDDINLDGSFEGNLGCGGWWWGTDCTLSFEVPRTELLVVFPNQLTNPAQTVKP